jgi:hypothetical protein
MFVQVRMNWLTQLRRALFPPRPTPPAARHRRPCVEALDQRVVPSADIWIASGTAPVSWDTPAAWSLGAAPRAGDDVLLRTDAQGSGSAPVTLGHATPLLNSVTLDGSWAGTLTLQTDGQLNAHVITLDARTHTGDEILLDAGTEVHSDMALELSGGSIAGAGLVQAEGSIQVNGISMIDPPTLGAQLQVGDGIASTTMTFAQGAVPLVVVGAGNIGVNSNASVIFDPLPSSGETVAVVSRDQASHAMTVNGGFVQGGESGEQLVALGVVVNSGVLEADTLHFTGTNGDGDGLTVNGGQVIILGSLSFDGGVRIVGGQVDVADGATLEAGTAAAPVASSLSGAGDLRLEGTFLSHGDFVMSGGVLETMGSADSRIVLDPGDTYFLMGGTVDGSPTVSGGEFPADREPSQPLLASAISPADTYLADGVGRTAASGTIAAPQPSFGLIPPTGSPDDITSGAAAWQPLISNGAPAIS